MNRSFSKISQQNEKGSDSLLSRIGSFVSLGADFVVDRFKKNPYETIGGLLGGAAAGSFIYGLTRRKGKRAPWYYLGSMLGTASLISLLKSLNVKSGPIIENQEAYLDSLTKAIKADFDSKVSKFRQPEIPKPQDQPQTTSSFSVQQQTNSGTDIFNNIFSEYPPPPKEEAANLAERLNMALRGFGIHDKRITTDEAGRVFWAYKDYQRTKDFNKLKSELVRIFGSKAADVLTADDIDLLLNLEADIDGVLGVYKMISNKYREAQEQLKQIETESKKLDREIEQRLRRLNEEDKRTNSLKTGIPKIGSEELKKAPTYLQLFAKDRILKGEEQVKNLEERISEFEDSYNKRLQEHEQSVKRIRDMAADKGYFLNTFKPLDISEDVVTVPLLYSYLAQFLPLKRMPSLDSAVKTVNKYAIPITGAYVAKDLIKAPVRGVDNIYKELTTGTSNLSQSALQDFDLAVNTYVNNYNEGKHHFLYSLTNPLMFRFYSGAFDTAGFVPIGSALRGGNVALSTFAKGVPSYFSGPFDRAPFQTISEGLVTPIVAKDLLVHNYKTARKEDLSTVPAAFKASVDFLKQVFNPFSYLSKPIHEPGIDRATFKRALAEGRPIKEAFKLAEDEWVRQYRARYGDSYISDLVPISRPEVDLSQYKDIIPYIKLKSLLSGEKMTDEDIINLRKKLSKIYRDLEK